MLGHRFQRPSFGWLFALSVLSIAVDGLLAKPTLAEQRAACSPGQGLGVSRIVEIDTSTGALFGAISTETREPRFLGPKEVVLTFDDGPMPAITRPILDTLDRYCTKATFYSVGRMAVAYPGTVRDILARGHTLGTHTWSHPLNLRRLSVERAREEIEKGHAAVTMAAGRPIAPFFRFPGLSDSGPLLRHLQNRGIAAFTVDVVSNDSYISDADRLLARTMREVEQHNGGIVLFHDIKAATARMLPRFLAQLQAGGYKVVHLRAKSTVLPVTEYDAALTAMLARSESAARAGVATPFFGAVHPASTAPEDGMIPVEALVPPARLRQAPVEVASRARSGKRASDDDARIGAAARPNRSPEAWAPRFDSVESSPAR